jgi:membrane protease YdiL (CAAX protease family)
MAERRWFVECLRGRELTLRAIGGESLLVVIAVCWWVYRGSSSWPTVVGWQEDTAIGLAVAVGLMGINYMLLMCGPDVLPLRPIRTLYRTTLRPLFADVRLSDVAVISIAAGIGEELFFRGVLQPEIGLVAASIVFGLVHMGGRGTFAFACWVAVMGLALGMLANVSEGLVAPIVAHSAYDAAAIGYLRWGSS